MSLRVASGGFNTSGGQRDPKKAPRRGGGTGFRIKRTSKQKTRAPI
jgi:hypothetical protein